MNSSLNLFSLVKFPQHDWNVSIFVQDSSDALGATERGKIVTRTNQVLFDYQIGKMKFSFNHKKHHTIISMFSGDKANASLIEFIFHQRILLIDPNTKNVQ